jgi:ribonucleoside-diphosphate reductase alpha chain
MDLYQQYIHISRYSRWRDDLGRRETWEETVQRYIDFFDKRTKHQFSEVLQGKVKNAILELKVMPSMRALMTAGEALERENLAGFNCSYLAINTKRSFAEALYILMCGTGVGFSCERQEVTKLPAVPDELLNTDDTIVVADSKEGWAKAYHALLGHLWNGDIPKIDYSKVRPAGARLKIFGGRASGPDPLKRLFKFTVDTFQRAKGRKLNSIEVHDMLCMIGEIVVVGGVRRSALISLSNLSDQRMRDAKAGQWWNDNPQRGLANNSVAYTEKPSAEIFMEEWLSLVKSKSGERGIFNRRAAAAQASRWGRRSKELSYGCNPCSEIILRDKQLCNLSEVVIREDDTMVTLMEKVEIATILGTLQATLTDFKFVSEAWARNTAEEALLGVSLTGIMDNALTSGLLGANKLTHTLNSMRDHARLVNAEWAEALGIKPSAAITCVKPSGTVSQLCNTASGIHARHNRNYIRTVRVDKKDPLYQFMKDKGFVTEDDVMRPDSTAVVSFAMSAPDGAVTRDQVTAMQALELWLLYQREWCEHKPSVTVTVRDEEWLSVGAWVYEHFDEVSGISFLPHTDHTYQQAPYQDMTPEEFAQWQKEHPVPEVDWRELATYEKTDNTVAMQTLACTSGACELP